jgi:hypothetical protein
MKKFYLHDGNTQKGPYDIDELRQQNISPQTPVWFNTLEDWTPAGQVQELKELFDSNPPPFRNTVSYKANHPPQPIKTTWIIALSIASFAFIAIILIVNKRANQAADRSTVNSSTTAASKVGGKSEIDEKERQRIALENAQEIINREYRNNWSKYITHKASDFEVGFFGGISDLKITVTNNTESIVDEVDIKIDYIKESGDLYETKEVAIANIQPGASKTVNAPETSRGIKIKTAISSITAKSLSFCYDLTKENQRKKANSLDPWKCR